MTIQLSEEVVRSAYEAADAVHELLLCRLCRHLAIHISYSGEYETCLGFLNQIVQRLKQDRSFN